MCYTTENILLDQRGDSHKLLPPLVILTVGRSGCSSSWSNGLKTFFASPEGHLTFSCMFHVCTDIYGVCMSIPLVNVSFAQKVMIHKPIRNGTPFKLAPHSIS